MIELLSGSIREHKQILKQQTWEIWKIGKTLIDLTDSHSTAKTSIKHTNFSTFLMKPRISSIFWINAVASQFFFFLSDQQNIRIHLLQLLPTHGGTWNPSPLLSQKKWKNEKMEKKIVEINYSGHTQQGLGSCWVYVMQMNETFRRFTIVADERRNCLSQMSKSAESNVKRQNQ
jgi:hypothetical protein